MLWLLGGMALAWAYQGFYVMTQGEGNWSSLLAVGSELPTGKVIAEELSNLQFAGPEGHDGQLFFVIARDPLNRRETDEVLRGVEPTTGPSYRYRRILFPLLAGGFGWFGPRETMYGMIFWGVFGFGLATAFTADLCFRWDISRITIFAATLNLGLIKSLDILVSDPLAMGLGMAGVALWYRGWSVLAIILLALSVLAKEYYVLFAAALALSCLGERRFREASLVAVLPVVPLACWMGYLWFAMPSVGGGLDRFSLPGMGILSSIPFWIERQSSFLLFGLMSLGLVLAAVTLTPWLRNRFLFWSCLLWPLMSLLVSESVWGPSNNILRSIAPLWCFVLMGVSNIQPTQTDPLLPDKNSRPSTPKDGDQLS